jgi:hypothetical protein
VLDWLPDDVRKTLGWKSRIAVSILRNVPMILDQASQAKARDELRRNGVDGLRVVHELKVKAYTDALAASLSKLPSATIEERVRIEQDIENIEGRIRQVEIEYKAMIRLDAPDHPDVPTGEPASSNAWYDQFSQYARARNESWRSELLARAFAEEILHPGSFGTHGLWVVGTMDRTNFQEFSAYLDIASQMDGAFILPEQLDSAETEGTLTLRGPFDMEMMLDIRGETPRQIQLQEFAFNIDGLGLIAAPWQTTSRISEGVPAIIGYGASQFEVATKCNVSFRMLGTTPLGSRIARLHTPVQQEKGQKLFDALMNWLKPNLVSKKEMQLANRS